LSHFLIVHVFHAIIVTVLGFVFFPFCPCAACLFFSLWVRTFGIKYLWKTLVIPINELNDNAIASKKAGYKVKSKQDDDELLYDGDGTISSLMSLGSMEIDPGKLGDISPEEKQERIAQLRFVAQKLFNAIIASEKNIPGELRELLQFVYTTVEYRYDEKTAYRAMGAFFFLRFVMPCLLAPHRWGILKAPPHPMAQRQIILLGKVLQSLANRTDPGQKEMYMSDLNDFIEKNGATLESWYNKVCNGSGPPARADVPEDVRINGLVNLYRYVYENSESIGNFIVEEKDLSQELVEELDSLLEDIGEI